MIGAIALATARQRLSSPMRLALLAFLFLPMVLAAVVMKQLSALSGAGPFALVLAAGAIGQDLSSGVLQLVFARPLTRSQYVLGRWIGASLPALALGWLQLGIAAAGISARGGSLEATELARMFASVPFDTFGAAAVLMLFSALVNGLGDIGLYAIGLFTSQMLALLGQFRQNVALVRASDELGRFLAPRLPLEPLFSGGAVSPFLWISYASTVTLCIGLAIVLVNRKELSYGAS